MSDFIHKLNGIALGIGNAENTGISVEVINRTGTQIQIQIGKPLFKKGLPIQIQIQIQARKKSKRRQRLRAVWKSSAGGAVTMVGTRYLY